MLEFARMVNRYILMYMQSKVTALQQDWKVSWLWAVCNMQQVIEVSFGSSEIQETRH
jgi:hypothetical protein